LFSAALDEHTHTMGLPLRWSDPEIPFFLTAMLGGTPLTMMTATIAGEQL
jgi:hypothetical protein